MSEKQIRMSVPVTPAVHKKLRALADKDGRALQRYAAKVLETHVGVASK